MNNQDWQGIFPALPTQFREDLSLDIDGTVEHLNQMIDGGVHGVVVLGSIGENPTLTGEEKRAVLRASVQAADGRVPILSGVAEFATAEAMRYAADAEAIGADGLMVLPGMAYRADAREAIAHHQAVARASGLPILIYNNPRYGVDLKPEDFLQLAEVDTIVAIKEAAGDPRRITDMINLFGDRFILFAGLDDIVLESVMLGATGTVFGLVNAFPAETIAMWELAQMGQWDEARAIYRWFMPLLHLDDHPKLVQYMKLCCQELGYGNERVRPPRLPLVGEEREHILQLVRTAVENRPDLGVAAGKA